MKHTPKVEKGAETDEVRTSAKNIVLAALLKNRKIEQATDLGGGYFLLKIGRSPRENPEPAIIPPVPPKKIKQLLKESRRITRSSKAGS